MARRFAWPGAGLLAAIAAGAPAWAEGPGCLDGAVEEVVGAAMDARSIELAGGRVVRLAGIETFALLDADRGKVERMLRDRLAQLAASAPLRVLPITTEPDRYGRLLALVARADGDLLQVIVAREGLAIAFGTGEAVPCFDEILAAEAEARQNRRGLWRSASLPAARPDSLRPRIGHFAIFEGRVASVGNRRATTYLNFGQRWSTDVTVEISAADRERFGGEAWLADLAGKRMTIRGFVVEKGGPMVAVSSPMQMQVLGADAEAPGKMP